MLRLSIALILSALAAAPESFCEYQLTERWNRFVQDANSYALQRNKGIIDSKLRAKLPKEWESIMRSECW